jgi:DNA gyrase/topoisomerase IV subunit B
MDSSAKSLGQKYQKKTPIQHILDRPDTYVDSLKVQEDVMDIYDDDLQKIVKKNIKSVPALYKIFDEIIVNAFDHTKTDPTCDTIKVSIDKEKNEISVFNNGKGIDVEIHPEHKIYIPELIFGELLTSTNYDDTEARTTGGRNGYGAKLTNIFSTKFVVETVDEERKRKFNIEFSDNMSKRTKPKITDYKLKSYTQITFVPDLKKFGLDNLSDDIIGLFKKRVYDIAGLGEKLKVFYNDKKIETNNFKKYISLYYPDEELIFDEQERWKVGVIYKPDNNFEQKSFVNGICTYKGGNHVEYVMKGIIKKVKDAILKKNKDLKIKDELIKENLIVFIDSTIVNPAFSSQTKEELKTKQSEFGSTYEMNDKIVTKIVKSGIVEFIIDLAKNKEKSILKNTDGKKTNNIKGIPKLEDAEWAGTKKSNQCRLILTEGDSAKGLAMAGRSAVEEGNCKYGVFPLKGKLLNVREATSKQLLENEEIINIKKILGLQHNKEYSTVNDLRYNSIVVLTDQDSVSGDTPLLLKKDNILDIQNIEDINNKWEKDIINNKDYGKSNYEIWTERGWTKIIKVIKHKVNKKVFRVLTHTGCVDVTEDHSLLKMDATEVSPKDIIVGNELLHSFPMFKEYQINIPNDLEKLSIREIWEYASKLKIRYYQTYTKSDLIKVILEFKTKYYHQFDSNNYNITEDEAYAMGLFFADGSCGTYYWDYEYKNKDRPREYIMHRESITWAISNTNLTYLEKAKKKLEKIYNYEFKIIKCSLSEEKQNDPRYSTPYKLIVNGNQSVREFVDKYRMLFYKNFETNEPTDKKVPIDILNNTHKIRQQFFEGYYDGDGSKTKDCKFFDVASKITTQGLYLLCKSLGYEVSINHNPKKPKIYVLTVTKGFQQFNPNQIKKIIDLGTQEIEVYDLETENHHFQAGIGSMIVHNTDGFHIKGLLMNFFHYFFPSLLKLNFIHSLATPIVKAVKGKDAKTFYNLTEYEDWKKKVDTNTWHIKYYKGLGTSNREEAKEYFNDFEKKLIKYTYAEKSLFPPEELKGGNSEEVEDVAESETSSKRSTKKGTTKKLKTTTVEDTNKEHICYEAMTLAFDKKRADDRKDWLKKYDRNKILQNDLKEIPICDFVHRELIHFSNDDINRSIPSVVDGMKPSQRKVQFGSILRKLNKKQDEIKVAQLSGFISEKTSYHHGEASLQGTIVGMAQNFVGSNNLNQLHPSGQFGTRLLGGKDSASPRYIFTYLEEWNRLIFRPEDDAILTYLNDDGTPIEPEYYVPIIPMVLVNGAQGIGTGFSTTILQYNPIQIIDNLLLMMESKPIKEMLPWYRGFKGKIEKSDNGYNIKGNYKVDKERSSIVITELPVGTWTTVYKEHLDKLEEDKVIKGYKDKNTDETVFFDIQLTDDNLYDLIEKKKLEAVFKLTNKETTSNMHCFNKKSVIKKYDTIYDILKEFYEVRLDYYKKRKQYQLDELEKELNVLDWKMKFIEGVIEGTIIVNNQTKEKINEQLTKLEFPKLSENKSYDYLVQMPIYSLSKEKIDELQKKIDNLEEEMELIQKTTETDRWKSELMELRKVIEKVYKTSEVVEGEKVVVKGKVKINL